MPSQKTKRNNVKALELQPIPDKIYFTIGEVGKLCDLKPHVLRYWEQEFTQLSPNKRRGNRRYYQHKDVLLVRRIRNLLYDQGFTIEGARQKLVGEVAEDQRHQKMYNAMRIAAQELEKLAHELETA